MRRCVSLVFACLSAVVITAPSPTSAFIFGDHDTETTLCANIGTGYHSPSTYPDGWPQVDSLAMTSPPSLTKRPLEGGITNWHCRTDTGLTTGGQSCAGWNGNVLCAGGVWRMTFPVNTPVFIGKQDIQLDVNGTGYARSMTKVEWDYDGNGSYETVDNGPWLTGTSDVSQCSGMGCPYSTRVTKSTYFEGRTTFPSLGDHTVNLRVSYSDGSSVTSTGTFTATVDTARASVDYAVHALTDQPYTLSARNSTSTSGFIAKYEWDLDGDGTFETDSGTASSYTTTPRNVGIWTPKVRVTSRGGSQDVGNYRIDVRLNPPSGDVGISINDGASYTNNKAVSLNLVWPAYATQVKVSNDGGFAASRTQTFDVAPTVSWSLDDTVAGLLPKVVYVRFVGADVNGATTYNDRTFQDDIVLDTTAPVLSSATASRSSGTAPVTVQGLTGTLTLPATAARAKTVRVSVRARDNMSGVSEIQFNSRATARGARSTKFATSVKVRTSSKTLWLRVKDGAGNFSRWRQVRVP